MNSTAQHTDLIDAPELTQTPQSGCASWDERGNSVWEWQTAPGIYSREVSSQQLQSLQAAELRLVDHAPGVTTTYSTWKRRYQDRFTVTPSDLAELSNELVMPAKRRDTEPKTSTFELFLKHLGLPA